jgi:adenylate cyclase class 2
MLGFDVRIDVLKRRRKSKLQWQGQAVEVALDEVEGLGTFVELEIIASEAELDAARARLVSLANELGLKDIERRSYSELMFTTHAGKNNSL